MTDSLGKYEQVWHCPPPLAGVKFKATQVQWDEKWTERHIYAVEVPDGSRLA